MQAGSGAFELVEVVDAGATEPDRIVDDEVGVMVEAALVVEVEARLII